MEGTCIVHGGNINTVGTYTYTWRGQICPTKGPYTRRDHTHKEDIHTKETCLLRGHTHRDDIQPGRHTEGTYREGTCIWRGSTQEGPYTRKDIHTNEHIDEGTYSAGTYILKRMYMNGYTRGGKYRRMNMYTSRDRHTEEHRHRGDIQ